MVSKRAVIILFKKARFLEEYFYVSENQWKGKCFGWLPCDEEGAVISRDNAGYEWANCLSSEAFEVIAVDGPREKFLANDNRESTFPRGIWQKQKGKKVSINPSSRAKNPIDISTIGKAMGARQHRTCSSRLL